ncbi:uncharacterized protein TNCV_1266291 [Trichonephila clavipes]|nr:uncharacterized protein TNCV_1266291 [Trichonephila clavipes]
MKKSVASKKTFLKFPEIVRKHHEDLLGTANGVIDITVSYDGTWQKRGHSSLYGIGIVIDILTGLIIDYEILSKYCPECTTAKRVWEKIVLSTPYGTNPTKKKAAKIM